MDPLKDEVASSEMKEPEKILASSMSTLGSWPESCRETVRCEAIEGVSREMDDDVRGSEKFIEAIRHDLRDVASCDLIEAVRCGLVLLSSGKIGCSVVGPIWIVSR